MNFKLRPWKSDDLDSLMKVANNSKIAQNLTNHFPHPYTRESGKGFIAMATSGEALHYILAIEVNGEAVGAIGLHFKTDIEYKNAEMGYWLGEPYWGQGIMTQAIKQMVVYGFEHWEINRIFARPFGTNIGSQKALEKAGFVLEARFEKTFYKNGEYLDELVYAIRR